MRPHDLRGRPAHRPVPVLHGHLGEPAPDRDRRHRRRAGRAASPASTWACSAGSRQLFGPFLTFVSLVPPLAILPILFITLGVDELAKVTLIFIGVFPLIARDIAARDRADPAGEPGEGAARSAPPRPGIIYRIVMPQVLPRLIDTVRLALGAAWLFLIAAEAIASTEGLGLPHLPGAPLPRDGRHPAVRGVDHLPRLRFGLAAAALAPAALPLVLVRPVVKATP